MHTEQIVASKVANGFLVDAKPKGLVSALGLYEAQRYQESHGGIWVGGRVWLTTTFLIFGPNALNRGAHESELEIVLPLASVEQVDFERAFFTSIVNARSEFGTLRFRCYGARAFADVVDTAVARARAALDLSPGQSFAEVVSSRQLAEELKRSLDAARDLLR